MPSNRKKKKPAANPARGFATTSTASKPRAEKPEDVSLTPSNGTSTRQTAATTPEVTGIDATESITVDNTTKELKDLSPEELEARLEQSELQQIVEKYATKIRRDASRQVARLDTDKRLTRTQAELLSTKSWLSDELQGRLTSSLISLDGESSPGSVKSSKQTPSGDTLLANLWTLQSVLQDLSLSDDLASQALQRALSTTTAGADDANGYIWGLSDTMEWLSTRTEGGLPQEYDVEAPPTVTDQEESEELIQQRIRSIKDRNAKPTKKFGNESEKTKTQKQMAEPAQQLLVSDSESDSDPDEMLSKYVEYKLRLMEHDPRKFGDGRPPNTGLSPSESRMTSRLRKMEGDPLFDQRSADALWREKRAQAFQQQREMRKLGLDTQPGASSSEASQTTSAADDASKEADAIAAEILSASNEDDDGLFEGMFDVPEAPNAALSHGTASTSTATVTLRAFNKIDGYSPRRILEESCKARDQGARVTSTMISETTYSCRHSILIQWSRDQEVQSDVKLPNLQVVTTKRNMLLEMTGIATPGVEQSEGYACTAAFFVIFAGSAKEEKAALRLPTSFRDLYDEFVAAKQEQTDGADREIVRSIRKIVEEHQASLEDQDVVLKAAFRNRSKQNSGSNTPDSSNEIALIDQPRNDLQALWARKTETNSYQTMLLSRSELPMFRFREQALHAVNNNQVTILCGETGCGKSTQMPAFILEDQLSRGMPCRIYCTEPRRISAVSLAQRVSEELGEDKNAVGTSRSLVGYAIRLESQSVASTRLIYATVGIVLRMLESNDGLKDLTHLIIDEVHERSIDTDFLLIVLKTLLVRRPNLKVVLMSATVDATRFSTYLGDAPIITVPGRTFPVRDLYLEDAIEMTGYTDEDTQGRRGNDEDDEIEQGGPINTAALSAYSKSTVKTLSTFDEYRINYILIMRILEMLATDPNLGAFNKAVLVFLPGIAEIRQLADMLSGHPMFSHGWLLFPLHSTFSNEEQQAAFKVPPPGMRKIVLATNIAETGITIPDVTCVIDTGKHKEMRFDEKKQLSRLIQSFISKANAKQRRGRAGRVQEGICFHLFTKHRHDNMMADQQLPEMLRLSLQDLVIRVKICKLGEIELALSEALDPPSVKNIRRAIDALVEVGALTAGEELTSMGQQIARLPLDAQLGKLVLLGNIFGCLDFALTTAAIASSKSPFLAPMNARRQADTVRLGFKRGDSDLLTAYNAYCTWRRVCTSPGISEFEFCKRNFLSQQNLANIEELKGQLLSAMADAGLVTLSGEDRSELSRVRRAKHVRSFVTVPASTNANDGSDTIISSVVAWSFYPKIVAREGKGWRSVANNQSLTLHPTSVNVLSPSPALAKTKYLSFYSIMQASSRFTNAQETTPVEPMALVLLAGDAKFDFYSGVITIDGNRLRFKVRTWKEMAIIKTLRTKVKSILAKSWKRPGRDMTDTEQEWFDVLLDMLRARDERKAQEKS